MPWQPLPRIAFAVATYPFAASSPADLPLQIGDELYVIEETPEGNWLRGYLVAPPSLLSGLTSVKGQTLEARVFSGIFPRSCVEVRELLGGSELAEDDDLTSDGAGADQVRSATDSAKSGLTNGTDPFRRKARDSPAGKGKARSPLKELPNGVQGNLSIPVKRDPEAPRPAAPVPMLKIGDETPTSASEPLIDEIASCLREWHSKNLHELLLSRQYGKLDQLSQIITRLNRSRQRLLYKVLTVHEAERLRETTVWDLVTVNKLCGGDVVVRDPATRGRVLTGDDSVVEVTKLQSIMSLLDEPPQPVAEATNLHHLLLDVTGFAGSSSEQTSLMAYLVTKTNGGRATNLSEPFVIDIPTGGFIGGLNQDAHTKTLFTDLSSLDIGDAPPADTHLFLVVKVMASQHIIPGKPMSRAGTGSQGYSRDSPKTPTSGAKSSRRSLMWGSKPSRSTFSRNAPSASTSKMASVTEVEITTVNGSRDGPAPPDTANSRTRTASDGVHFAPHMVGLGAIKLNAIMKRDEEVEQVINIHSQIPALPSGPDSGDEIISLIREIMSSPGNAIAGRREERLQVHLKGFNHPDADRLIKATPTMLAGVFKTSRMGFSGAPTKPRSDIYMTVSAAALARQNLLSRYGGSATSMPSSMSGANLQVSIEVRKTSGERVHNCIFGSSNSKGVTTFQTVAVERGEPWNQTVRLAIPPEDVSTCHVVMLLADMPELPFAIAYMPLWDKQAFIRDGPHSLFFYKIDENTATPQPSFGGRGGYLSLPWAPRGRDEYSTDVTGPLATLLVESFLCSTRSSQNRELLALTRWRDLPKSDLPTRLKQLIFVPEIEVVKLLSDVLDSLFAILVEHAGSDEFEDLVFSALVRVLSIVHDRRFNLGPLVDHYAVTRFNYPFATTCLVRSFARLLENPAEPETARKLRETLKVVRHILKFIAQARGQQREKEAGIGITTSSPGFARQVRAIFKSLDEMMRSTAPVLIGSQTLAVQHFHTWLPELAGVLTTEEILHVAIDFMDSCTDVKGKLILYKLILIINYSKLDLFSHPDQKMALSTNTVRWINPHWGYAETTSSQWRDQIRLCCSVLATQIDYLGPEIPDYIPKVIDSYLSIQSSPQKPRSRFSLLFPSSYPFPSKPIPEHLCFDETLVELSAILSSLSSSPSGMQLEMTDDDMAVVIHNLLRVHMSILSGEAFPEEWLSAHIYHHKSTMRTLQYLASILLESFLPDPDEAENFHTELWKLFFTTLLKLVGSSSLALETFPEQKRRAVWKIAGDVREHGADLLRRTWEAIGWDSTPDERSRYGLSKIGGYQVQYVPTLVSPIVELCLSVHQGLRKMAVEVLQTMIVSEWTLSEDLSAIQTEMIDCLDAFFKTKPLTESILQKLFVSELLERFQPLSEIPDEPLYEALQELIGTLDELLDLLVAVHSGDGSTGAGHIINRLRLMEFLRDMQKEEIFVRYVHQLANLQAESRNFTEAGLALRLHAELYDWDPIRQTLALPDPELPAQTHFERKERIYFDMIKHFEEGESWSNALTAYKELQAQYESNTFDFAKLARTERAIATIYETISKSEKLIPRYFKVVFKGLGFPSTVRDKAYVYEGSPNEKASAFTDRMQEQYPSAQIVASGDIDEAEGQYLAVSAITPHRDLTHQVFQRARVPQVIRDFLVSSHPQLFSVSTKRNTSGPVEGHYAEKLIITTAEPFPTILRRSEIIDMSELRLTAHETALERIVRKTQEMTMLERRITEGNEDNCQLLVDAISISVNPSSENSVACYRRLLPLPEKSDDEDFDDEEDELELDPQDTAIKMALVDHAMMVKRCLALFARSDIEILTRRLEEQSHYFEETFAPELAIFAPPQPAPEVTATPAPIYRSPNPGEMSPEAPSITATLQRVTTEEASIIQPIVRQRGARLSFLGGKNKSLESSLESSPISADPSSPNSLMQPHSRNMSRELYHRTLFRTSNEGARTDASGDWHSSVIITGARPPDHQEQREDSVLDKGLDIAAKRTGSVRKRLSMLKLGSKKGGKAGSTMSSLDEE